MNKKCFNLKLTIFKKDIYKITHKWYDDLGSGYRFSYYLGGTYCEQKK